MLQHAQTFVLSILLSQISGIASGQNLKNDNKAVTPQPRILSISDLKGVVLCLDINSEGTKVLLGSDWGGLTIRDTDSGKVLNVLHKNPPIPTQEELNKPIGPPLQLPFEDEFWPVLSVAFEPNGSHVAAAIPMAGAKEGDHQVCKLRIWDTNTGKLLPSPDYDRSSIRALAFETSTGRIHSLDMNRRITSWQVSSGRQLSEFGENQREFSDPFPPYWDTAFGGHGQRAISVMDDKTDEEKVPDPTIKLWDLPSRNYRSIDSRPMAGDTALKSATLSRDGKQGAIPAAAGKQNGQQTKADPEFKGHTEDNGKADPSTFRTFNGNT
jgi:WD40 repeat protein